MACGEERLGAFCEVHRPTDRGYAESECGNDEAPKRLTDQQPNGHDDQSHGDYCESRGDDR